LQRHWLAIRSDRLIVRFVVAEWRDAGGSSESPRLIAPWHVHHKDDEAWYVLEGELRVRMGAEEVAVKAGASAFVHGERYTHTGILPRSRRGIC